jgi:hypothetical protein
MGQKAKPIKEELLPNIIAFLSQKLSKVIKYAALAECEKCIRILVSFGVITADNKATVAKQLKKLGADAADVAQRLDDIVAETMPLPIPSESSQRTIQDIAQMLDGRNVFEREYGMRQPAILLADKSGEAPEAYLQEIIKSYREAERPVEEADKIAEKLDRESLVQALTAIFQSRFTKKDMLKVVGALFRYVPGSKISTLYQQVYSDYYQTEVNRALLLNDTKEAMLFIDKMNMLDQYAMLRGTDADTLRDTVLSDFGLHSDGSKLYDLGNKEISALLMPDLSLSLVDQSTGKAIKSIPKKNSDPEKYAAAKRDYDELKKNIKRVVKNRIVYLLRAYCNAESFSAKQWKALYLDNPVLNHVAQLLVWSQGGKTFTPNQTGAIDSTEQPYSITDDPIKIAHPMEMKADDVGAWQKYFTSHGFKQPFEQIWEPVREPGEIAKDRYVGCMIPYYRFLNQGKHGISVEDYDFHNEIYISLDGCETEIERIDWRRHEIEPNDRFEIKSFTFKRYTRQVNHLVAYFDRVTVWDRVRKDDLTVIEQLDHFTLAQITEFIAAAQEADANNVLAALLDYKNARFADFDPMAEFTLEW